MLSERFFIAFRLAVESHEGQVQKSRGAPYIFHPMAVASIILEHGGSEDVAIAGLLHDVIEDADVAPELVERGFGPKVLQLVQAVTNPPIDWKKYPEEEVQARLREYRLQYLEQIRGASADVQLLSAADKLHNAKGMLDQLYFIREDAGEGKTTGQLAVLVSDFWGKFRGKRGGTIWYYRSCAEVYSESEHPGVRQLGRALNRVAEAMELRF